MVTGCHNYVDKYLPLFMMRQISEVIDSVQTSIKLRYKLKRYMELKEEKLTEAILDDDGLADLTRNKDRIMNSLRSGQPLQE